MAGLWCWCRGDWFGPACEAHPFVHASFLPSNASLHDPAVACAQALRWSRGSAALLDRVDTLQSAARRCSAAPGHAPPLVLDTSGLVLDT